MAATSLADLLARVPSLDTDAAYKHVAEGTTITVVDAADPEFSIVVELDAAAHTFVLTENKPSQPSGPRRFEAGGIHNVAKRNGLRGFMPNRRSVKESLLEFLERNGWKRAR